MHQSSSRNPAAGARVAFSVFSLSLSIDFLFRSMRLWHFSVFAENTGLLFLRGGMASEGCLKLRFHFLIWMNVFGSSPCGLNCICDVFKSDLKSTNQSAAKIRLVCLYYLRKVWGQKDYFNTKRIQKNVSLHSESCFMPFFVLLLPCFVLHWLLWAIFYLVINTIIV